MCSAYKLFLFSFCYVSWERLTTVHNYRDEVNNGSARDQLVELEGSVTLLYSQVQLVLINEMFFGFMVAYWVCRLNTPSRTLNRRALDDGFQTLFLLPDDNTVWMFTATSFRSSSLTKTQQFALISWLSSDSLNWPANRARMTLIATLHDSHSRGRAPSGSSRLNPLARPPTTSSTVLSQTST